MDGLLVDSEPHWRAAERAIFDPIGLILTHDQCKQTTGMPILDVVQYWHARRPWSEQDASGQSHQQLANAITHNVHARIAALAEPMPGARDALEFFCRRGIPAAIASASPMSLIEVVIDRLGFRPLLAGWHSATLEAHNKPAPDVYLGTARLLGVLPAQCLAFEDSGSGVRSAHAAGMRTIAIPAAFEREDPKFDIATHKIPSLMAFDETLFNHLHTR